MSVALRLEEVPEDPEAVQRTYQEAATVLRAATGSLNHPQISDHVKSNEPLPVKVLTVWVEAMATVMWRAIHDLFGTLPVLTRFLSDGFKRLLLADDMDPQFPRLFQELEFGKSEGKKKSADHGPLLLFPFSSAQPQLTASNHPPYQELRYGSSFSASDYQLTYLLLWAFISEESYKSLLQLFAENNPGIDHHQISHLPSHQWLDNVFYSIHGAVYQSCRLWTEVFFRRGRGKAPPKNKILWMDKRICELFLLADAVDIVSKFFLNVGRNPVGVDRFRDECPSFTLKAPGDPQGHELSYLTWIVLRHQRAMFGAYNKLCSSTQTNENEKLKEQVLRSHAERIGSIDLPRKVRPPRTAGKLNWLQNYTQSRRPVGDRGHSFDPRYELEDGKWSTEKSPLKCIIGEEFITDISVYHTWHVVQQLPPDLLDGLDHHCRDSNSNHGGRGYVPVRSRNEGSIRESEGNTASAPAQGEVPGDDGLTSPSGLRDSDSPSHSPVQEGGTAGAGPPGPRQQSPATAPPSPEQASVPPAALSPGKARGSVTADSGCSSPTGGGNEGDAPHRLVPVNTGAKDSQGTHEAGSDPGGNEVEPGVIPEKGESESAAVSVACSAVARSAGDYVRNDTEEAAAVLKLQILTASESVDRPEGAPVPHQGLASDRLQSYQAELDSMSDSLKKCREAKIVLEIVRVHYRSKGLHCG